MNYKTVYPIAINQGPTMDDSYILMLMVPGKNVEIPIIIGENEAQAIILAHEGTVAQRPTTLDLMCNIMRIYDLKIKKVTIDRFEEGVFYATIHITDGLLEKHIDSRTSDAVALALMNDCDIEAAESVIEETAIDPDTLENSQIETPKQPTLEELQQQLAVAEEREEYEEAAEIQKLIDLLYEDENNKPTNE